MILEFCGEKYEIRFVKSTYRNGNLYLGIQDKIGEDEWDSFCDITVNFSVQCGKNCAFLHISDMSKEVYGLIRPYIKETGRTMENGFVTYPEVFFDEAFVNAAVSL